IKLLSCWFNFGAVVSAGPVAGLGWLVCANDVDATSNPTPMAVVVKRRSMAAPQMPVYSFPTEWNLLQFRPFNRFCPLNWVCRAAGGAHAHTRSEVVWTQLPRLARASKKEIRTK